MKDMLDIGAKFEKIVYGALIIMLMIVLIFAVGELAWTLFGSLTNPPPGLLENYGLTTQTRAAFILGIDTRRQQIIPLLEIANVVLISHSTNFTHQQFFSPHVICYLEWTPN